jgi:hypothetical protein
VTGLIADAVKLMEAGLLESYITFLGLEENRRHCTNLTSFLSDLLSLALFVFGWAQF